MYGTGARVFACFLRDSRRNRGATDIEQSVGISMRLIAFYRVCVCAGLMVSMQTQAQSSLEISGSSTIQPIIEALRGEAETALGVGLELRGGGSGAGIRAAREGRGIGMVSRALADDEKRALRFITMGFDALAMIVHRDNPVSSLSKAQIVQLFSGEASDWQALGWESRPVLRITKELGRSTLDLFEDYSGMVSAERADAGGKPLIKRDSYTIGSNLEAMTLVGGMPGAIGYVSLGSVQAMIAAGMPIKIVALDGVMPSAQSIAQRTYPIVRELNMVYRFESEQIATLNQLLLSDVGQDVVRSFGFLPVSGQ